MGKMILKSDGYKRFHWLDTTLNSTSAGWQMVLGPAFTWRTECNSDAETTPDYRRFYSNRSYPAFSYCSINQNPKLALPTDGDPYGAINGYLDWKDKSISDKPCGYSIKCFIKDLYVGGPARRDTI